MAGAGLVIVVAGVAAGLLATAGGSAGLPPSRPSRFEVVYQVLNSSTGPARRTWEVLKVSDPFDVSDLTYDSDPFSGAKPVSGTISTFDRLYDLSDGRPRLVSDRQPGLGSGDQALVAELQDLKRRGLATSTGEQRRIAGEGCSVYRFSEPPVGPLTPPAGADHDDLCLSTAGLELGERWTLGGRLILQRTAVEVTVGGSDNRIAGPPSVTGAPEPSVAVLRVGPPTQPSFLAPPPTPSGFTAMGPVQAIGYNPSNPTQASAASMVWAFRRGGDLVTVEAGEGQYPWNDAGSPTSRLTLAGLGPAESVMTSDGPEIQVQVSGGKWVRADGTVPLRYLASYAGRLRLA
jgi:hypothetical protein